MLRSLTFLLVSAVAAQAQTPALRPAPADTTEVPAGSDDVIALPVPQAPAAPGGLDRPVRYTARDSIAVRLAPRDSTGDAGDVVTLFGAVQTEYEGTTITAGRVDYDSGPETLRATGVPGDSASVPTAVDEAGTFTGEVFVYNLRTQRGRVTGARTAVEDGYLLGGIIKQQDAHVVFAQDAAYTTCELDHPHYALEAGRIKIVDGKKVYTGPVRLTLLGIPMPVVLPFGYFPAAEGRRSGPLAVDYGQDTFYGLYLGNVGWYWAISDYLDAQIAAKVGTAGSVQVSSAMQYNRRYAYSGRIGLSLGRLRSGESTDPGFAPRTPVGVRWDHNQTFPGGQRLTSSVDLQTTSQRQTDQAVSSQIQGSTTSRVSYSQQWPSVGRSLTLQSSVSQNFLQNATTATLPSLSLNQQRRYPFRRGRDDRWYEKIGVSYSGTATNGFAYAPVRDSTVTALDALLSPSAFRQGACPLGEPDCDRSRFDYEVSQSVPVSASFTIPRFNLSLGPSLTFTERWVGESIEQRYIAERDSVAIRRVPGFTAVRQAVLTASASTEVYGTFPLRIGSLDGLRHTVSPRVSFNLQPDYAAAGFVREVQVDSAGSTRRYSIVPGLPTTATRSMTFDIGNTFVGRVVRTDSTGETQREPRQLLSLLVSGGYNLGNARAPIQDLQTSFTTRVFGFNASGRATLSAYAPDTVLSTATALTYFDVTGRPLRLTGASVQMNRTFQSARRSGARDVRAVPVRETVPEYDPARSAPRSAAVGYLDYSAPWSASVGLSLSRTSGLTGETTTRAAIDVNQFNARLTPRWAVTGSTGLDLTTLEITQTRLGLRRDLHCWEMSIDWQPIGRTRSFGLSLYVKGGLLRDLLRLDVSNSAIRAQGLNRSPF